MKEHGLSDLAIAEAKKHARRVFEKRGNLSYQAGVRLKEDELTALLARAFDAGQKARGACNSTADL